MADLYVCPTCGETEDCACHDLSEARRNLVKAEGELRHKLGWLTIRLVARMPDRCGQCASVTPPPPAKLCPMCAAVEAAKRTIDGVLPGIVAPAMPKRSNAR